MRKEMVVAIILGFTLGLLITGGIWWINKSNSSLVSKPAITPSPILSPSPSSFPSSNKLFLDIVTPQDNSIINTEKTDIEGKTLSHAVVVLIYPEGENIVEADDQGQFTSKIVLQGGANEIHITAYDGKGNKKEVVMSMVYSTAKI